MVVRKFDNKRFQITVEERRDNSWIVTFWDKEDCYKEDRNVYVFETFGGAMDEAFGLLVKVVGGTYE